MKTDSKTKIDDSVLLICVQKPVQKVTKIKENREGLMRVIGLREVLRPKYYFHK